MASVGPLDQPPHVLGSRGPDFGSLSRWRLWQSPRLLIETLGAQMQVRMMSELFDEDPGQWGMRGDPYAWAAISRRLATVPVPQDARDVESLLTGAFKAVVGVDMDDPNIPRFVI